MARPTVISYQLDLVKNCIENYNNFTIPFFLQATAIGRFVGGFLYVHGYITQIKQVRYNIMVHCEGRKYCKLG